MLVPLSFVCKDGYPLGDKVSSVRKGKIALSEKEKQIITDIGFIWLARGLDVDNVRVQLKRFVEKFNEFVTKHRREPKASERPKNQEEKDEKNLYTSWLRYRQAKNLNADEINYLQEHGIEDLEEYTDTVRKAVKNFVEKFNGFVSEYKKNPMS